jgi:hypothetical protein
MRSRAAEFGDGEERLATGTWRCSTNAAASRQLGDASAIHQLPDHRTGDDQQFRASSFHGPSQF